MKRRAFSMAVALAIVLGLTPSGAVAVENPGALQPGETVTYEQRVPVNVVFLGYDEDDVNRQGLLNQLPATYEPIVRVPPIVYGFPGREIGYRAVFEYAVTFAPNRLTNDFFRYLREIGTPGRPTDFQQMYNDQTKNVLDVTGRVLYIDAPTVEAWLATNLNPNPASYTVVFINWYGRDDFRFHVYTKTDEPDPDTGYNFGALRASRKMIAWGGTSSRLWFHDLSAGPEAWTNNWNVDDRDLDGNGVEDYRMPPVWEYAPDGYRRPGALTRDLAMVTRFVAINLLFTSSPLFDPLVAAPDVRGRRVVHVNLFEDDPASLGADFIDATAIRAELADLQPYYDWEVNLVDRNPIDNQAGRALRIFTGALDERDCWVRFGDPFAELFCFFDRNLDRYVPDYRDSDYVLPIFGFNTTPETLGPFVGLLGFADDNWTDGTQSFVFEFNTSDDRDLGYGFTTTSVHEAGHHFGLSHPHDGYDSELGIDYGPFDEFQFVWSGDESDSVMSYLGTSNSFSRFDRDNLYRWEFAGYLNLSNNLLDDILAHPRVAEVRRFIPRADQLAASAIAAFNNWDYLAAATNARNAYVEIARAADDLNIETPTDAARLAGLRSAPVDVDPIRFPNN